MRRWQVLRAYLRARQATAGADRIDDSRPIVTPDEYRRTFAEWNVLGLTLEQARENARQELATGVSPVPEFSFGLSTGTMGEPNVFLTTDAERAAWLGTLLARALPVRLLPGLRVAVVLKHNNRLYSQVGARSRFAFFPAAEPAARWAEALRAFAPTVLVGPPSVLEGLAEVVTLRPKLLLTGGEVLFAQDAARLQAAYGVAPTNIYQATEGFLALGCAKGMMHWNRDLVEVEMLALPRGRAVPVITDRQRSSQRFVRYRMDDVVRLAATTACACGNRLPAFAAVEGRAGDVLLTETGPVFPEEVHTALREAGAAEYRLVQRTEHQYSLAVHGGTNPGQLAALRELVGEGEVTAEDYQPWLPGEKRRRTQRLFDAENTWLGPYQSKRAAF